MIEDTAVPGSPGEALVTPPPIKTPQPGRGMPPRKRNPGRIAARSPDWITGEPPIDDFFEDPLVRAVLRRDGLGLEDLAQAIALGRRRLATNQHSRAA